MTEPHPGELGPRAPIGEGKDVDLKEAAKLVVRAIEGGGFEDLAAVYLSGQCGVGELVFAVEERASSIVGQSVRAEAASIAVAVIRWAKEGEISRTDDGAHWLQDHMTWAKAAKAAKS